MSKSDVDILVVGSCNMDLISYTEKVPKPGETITGKGFMMANGGKGGNQATMISRLGGKVAMLARVGDDSFGVTYREQFEKYGVDTSALLVTPNTHTGVAAIWVDESTGENQIVLSAGANDLLCVEDLENYMTPHMLSHCKILVVQLEVKREITLHALKLAKKHGVITVFNTAPAFGDLDAEFFKNTDVICFNESEAEILTGMTTEFTDTTHNMQIINRILDFGCKAAVFSQGKNGASLMYASNRELLYQICSNHPAKKVVDTTGAGDCLVGCMVYFMAENYTSKDLTIEQILTPAVIQKSTNIATLSVQKLGAQNSYPTFDEIPPEYLIPTSTSNI